MPDKPGGKRGDGRRRLIAGLRITRQDEALLDVVRPLFPEADSEGELAYRLWRRGLELSLAEAGGLGAELPPGMTERHLASLVAQRLLLCMPLLRRTGMLGLLENEAAAPGRLALAEGNSPTIATGAEALDASASDAIAGLGGADFL